VSHSMAIWGPPPDRPRFEGSEIHVWRWMNHPGQEPDAIFSAVLSAEELSRAARFIRPQDGERFAQAHGMLRSILGSYLGRRSEDIAYQNNAYGKPSLAGPAVAEFVRFNMAHSMDMVLVAVSPSHEVGVDVEFRHPMADLQSFIQRNFSSAERRFFATLPAQRVESEFFVHWTLKEAYIKGIGLGLTCPLQSFSVEPDRSRPGPGMFYAVVPDNGPQWQCQLLPLAEGYVGAVAAPSISSDAKLYNYQPVAA
jgi:4'-phosphopantetheinyl transferase